jgi:hypothetical protein
MNQFRDSLKHKFPFLAHVWGMFRWYASRRGIHQLLTNARLVVQHWGNQVVCPFCGWRGREFYPHPDPHPRPNTLCPRCKSKERHRLLYLYMQSQDIFADSSLNVLEIGPERCWPLFFGALSHVRYLGLDIASPRALVHGDITALPLSEKWSDLLICYHVLEYVPDDEKAMQELYRLLSPRGIMFTHVPIQGMVTDEDPMITDPEERERRFGQADHVRQYGADFVNRLMTMGFDVEISDFAARLSQDTVRRFGIVRDDLIYVCRRGPSR